MSLPRVLNLYAGIGGNRKLWRNVQVTAVEKEPEIARAYQDFFPDDVVIVGDAHAYLLENYANFDFIWSSPECQTHGQYRYRVGVLAKGFKAVYPDMSLWQEIYLLKYHAKCKWVVENTVSYYEHPFAPIKVARHYFWANFAISDMKLDATGIRDKNKIGDLEAFFGVDLSPYKIPNKRQVLRNMVRPELGLHIFQLSNIALHRTAGTVPSNKVVSQPELLSASVVGSHQPPVN